MDDGVKRLGNKLRKIWGDDGSYKWGHMIKKTRASKMSFYCFSTCGGVLECDD
jgi:hypothetical protein